MADQITLPELSLRRISVSSMDNNCYLLTERAGGAQLLIDAAAEADAIAALLAAAAVDSPRRTRLTGLLTTHAHADHVGALAEVIAAHPGVETLAGDADAEVITDRTGVPIARRLHHGDVVGLGGVALAVIGLRGHTPGSIALACTQPNHPVQLFTGDSLFPGGLGNTGNDPARFASLYADVVARIFEVFEDDTVVWPGHGRPTTLGAERPHLAQWQARGW